MKTKQRHSLFARGILLMTIVSLALLSVSLLQFPLEPMMQKVYSLLSLSTIGLLALHYASID